mmetsp:Transcript_36764/g.80352  ORF Transcript_36764/g.80352 Transcript_36764/m.80352 type:complete len:170 (-) Transcript_36764:100-609(-)
MARIRTPAAGGLAKSEGVEELLRQSRGDAQSYLQQLQKTQSVLESTLVERRQLRQRVVEVEAELQRLRLRPVTVSRETQADEPLPPAPVVRDTTMHRRYRDLACDLLSISRALCWMVFRSWVVLVGQAVMRRPGVPSCGRSASSGYCRSSDKVLLAQQEMKGPRRAPRF